MKKSVNILLVFVLAVTCLFAFCACKNQKQDATETTTGLVCKIKTDDDGEKYAVATKYTLSKEDADKVSKGDYADIMKDDIVINEYVVDDKTYPIKEIESGAFSNQLVFKKVTIGENVEKVGSACFAGCTNLEELVLNFVGEKVDAVNEAKTLGYLFGTTSFNGGVTASVAHVTGGTATSYFVPSALKKVTVTGSVLSDFAFNGMPIKEVEITGAVEYIGEGAFGSMTAINTVKIPATVKEIGKLAFANSSSIYKIDFSEATALTTIYQEAFAGCSMLGYGSNEVLLPSSVSKIYNHAFKDCTSLKTIDLTQTAITEIPTGCFYGCTNLTEVKYATGVTVGNDAIPGSANK